MKTALCLVLFLAGFNQVAVRAGGGNLRAAVITQTTTASLKLTQGKVQGSRQTLEVGQVFEVASVEGAMPELKIDADRVVAVSPSVIKMRECTSQELDAAKKKFNSQNFEAERKNILAAYQERVDGRIKTMLGSSCPKRGQAQGWAQEARQKRDSQLKDVEQKKQALLKEAIAWASAK